MQAVVFQYTYSRGDNNFKSFSQDKSHKEVSDHCLFVCVCYFLYKTLSPVAAPADIQKMNKSLENELQKKKKKF